jgi:hypothetical protein
VRWRNEKEKMEGGGGENEAKKGLEGANPRKCTRATGLLRRIRRAKENESSGQTDVLGAPEQIRARLWACRFYGVWYKTGVLASRFGAAGRRFSRNLLRDPIIHISSQLLSTLSSSTVHFTFTQWPRHPPKLPASPPRRPPPPRRLAETRDQRRGSKPTRATFTRS